MPGRSTTSALRPPMLAWPRKASTVVPGKFAATARYPTIALNRVDLPALGCPTRATRRTARGTSALIRKGRSPVDLDKDPSGETAAEGDAATVHLDEDRAAPPPRSNGAHLGSRPEAEAAQPHYGAMPPVDGHQPSHLTGGE